MRLEMKQVIDRHKNIPAVVAGHGPNLNSVVERIELLQKEEGLIRFSLNNWFDFFMTDPHYWVLANNEATVSSYCERMNQHNSTVLFADTVDLVDYSFVEQNLQCDFLPYDQRHFKGHTCTQIWSNFHRYFYKEENPLDRNFNFAYYGNNVEMWHPTPPNPHPGIRWYPPHLLSDVVTCCSRVQEMSVAREEAKQFLSSRIVHEGKLDADIDWAVSINDRLTIQEQLQKVSQYTEHYSPGDSVILHAIAFAIIMGCNPIYIAGMDLDYSVGYADGKGASTNDGWKREQSNLINDLRILNESAKKRNIEIINLKPEAWYKTFKSIPREGIF